MPSCAEHDSGRRLELDRDALLAVQSAGYAVEAGVIGVQSLPAQEHTIDDLPAESIWVAEKAHRAITRILGLAFVIAGVGSVEATERA